MKTCRYIVEIEMPDGDMISANWLKDIIQEDCDSEDKERQKVTVRGLDLPEGLDEAAEEYAWQNTWLDEPNTPTVNEHLCSVESFKAGAEWMASQGLSTDGEVIISHGNKTIEHKSRHGIQETTIPSVDIFDIGDKVIVQIRKAE